jgi:hypothetical protein
MACCILLVLLLSAACAARLVSCHSRKLVPLAWREQKITATREIFSNITSWNIVSPWTCHLTRSTIGSASGAVTYNHLTLLVGSLAHPCVTWPATNPSPLVSQWLIDADGAAPRCMDVYICVLNLPITFRSVVKWSGQLWGVGAKNLAASLIFMCPMQSYHSKLEIVLDD